MLNMNLYINPYKVGCNKMKCALLCLTYQSVVCEANLNYSILLIVWTNGGREDAQIIDKHR